MLRVQLLGRFRADIDARNRLAELLWIDGDSDRARHSLNTALWRLQTVLKSSRDQSYVRVSPPSLAEFCARAVEVYSGELLPDCYDDWAQEARERLQPEYLQALDGLLAYYTNANDHAPAINVAERLLTCDPLREDIQRQLIALCLETDEPALALKQYRHRARILRSELGAEPSRTTQALLARVLAARPAKSSCAATGDANTLATRLRNLAALCNEAQ